jgi:hypothetical protein
MLSLPLDFDAIMPTKLVAHSFQEYMVSPSLSQANFRSLQQQGKSCLLGGKKSLA